jgi:3-methyladenine DNA glycosylase AlkD
VSNSLAVEIERRLRDHHDPDRAAGARRYLKSDLEFLGVRTPQLRAVLKTCLTASGPLDRATLVRVVHELWARGVFELRAAAVELLERHVAVLEPADLDLVERLLRESRTWALIDALAPCVAGPMLERFDGLWTTVDMWAEDDDFWLRRAALLVHLLPLRRGDGDFARFARTADAMLDEREFFIRKAIGWVLREAGKKRPELVVGFLAPRLGRASGLTVREAVKHVPPQLRSRLHGRCGGGPNGRP